LSFATVAHRHANIRSDRCFAVFQVSACAGVLRSKRRRFHFGDGASD
jgi:hypothetical protein